METRGALPVWERPEARRLAAAIGITAIIMVAELVGGLLSNSLALLSDAGHMFTDLLALTLSLFAVWAGCRPASARASFGYYRVEILAALANGSLLFLIACTIVWEAVQRLMTPQPIQAGLMIVVAGVGLVANAVSVWLLSLHGCGLNLRAARWHVLGDALSSVGVILGGAVIWTTGWMAIDPLLSCAIAVVIVIGAIRLLKESVDVLLETTPAGISVPAVRREIESIEGIAAVHDLHVWCITTGMNAMSGHVVVEPPCLARSDDLLNEIKKRLRTAFGIEHTTIQVESEQYDEIGHIH